MKTYPLLILLSVVLLSACRKDPNIVVEVPYQPDSINFVNTPGSWWKYEWYEVDSLGNENILGEQDCVYVVGDTVIYGNTFTHYTGDTYTFPTPTNWYWRDSSHYLVDPGGNKLFSTFNKIDTLGVFYSSIYNVYYITDGIEYPKSVPAGTFNSYFHQSHYHNVDGTHFTACDSIYIKQRTYSKGVGIISEQLSYISQIQNECKYMERRLSEYYIAE